jgi:hypothetical protein
VEISFRLWGQPIGPIFKGKEKDFLILEDDTDWLSRNVGKELPIRAALRSRESQISSAKTNRKG